MAYKYNCDPNDTGWNNLIKAQNGTVDDLVEMLNKHEIAFMIRPTGFGKTHLMIELAKRENYEKVLYLYPLEVIRQSIYESYHKYNKNGTPIDPSDTKDGIKFTDNEQEHKKWPDLPYIEFCTYDKMLEDYKNLYRVYDGKQVNWDKLSKDEELARQKKWESLSEAAKQKLRDRWIKDRLDSIELLILDEAHRTGAEGFLTYWPSIYKLTKSGLKSNRLHVLGATATPIRTDPKIDVEDAIFSYKLGGENKSSRITDFGFEDCWKFSIMQKPYYIRGILDKKEEKEFILAKAKEDKSAISKLDNLDISFNQMEEQLDYLFDSVAPIKETIYTGVSAVMGEELTNTEYIRLLVFHNDSKSLLKNHAKINKAIKDAFSVAGYNMFNSVYITSDIESIRNSGITISNVSAISNRDNEIKSNPDLGKCEVDIIHSIDMLNMGYHVGKVTGIVTMRATGSEIIYYQQIGRCISVRDGNKPLIIDLANAAAELLDRTTNEQREDASNKIKKFIEGCEHDEYQNKTVDDIYKYINMCFDTEPLDEGLLDFWYFNRKSPIYFILGISKALGKKETLSTLLKRIYDMCDRRKLKIITDDEYCMNYDRIDKRVKEKLIKNQSALLTKVLKTKVKI